MTIVFDDMGDLFNCGVQTVVCPVNTVGVMGAGLALRFSKRFPGLLQAYRSHCRSGALRVGTLIVVDIPRCDRKILLFPTKEHFSKPSELDWIEQGARVLVESYEQLGITEVAFPPVGCGCGELDYVKMVRPALRKIFADCALPVHLVVPNNLL